MNTDQTENQWRELVLKHTSGGRCNFQAAADELAELVRAAERERCAKVCDRVQIYHAQRAVAEDDEEYADFQEAEACGAEDCAEAIRMGERWFEPPNTEQHPRAAG